MAGSEQCILQGVVAQFCCEEERIYWAYKFGLSDTVESANNIILTEYLLFVVHSSFDGVKERELIHGHDVFDTRA